MTFDFDTIIDRRGTDSMKWAQYGDAMPLWVADMDFRSPEPVIQALRERADHGVFGYAVDSPDLKAVMQERLRVRHHMAVRVEDIQTLPGLVVGMNLVARSLAARGDGVALMTPIYPPFLSAVEKAGLTLDSAPLTCIVDGIIQRYEIDFDALEAAITPRTRLFMLCNPHNPIGRAYTRAELERIAELCLRHDLYICSDEIHCDLMLEGEHVSIASLSPEVAQRTVTLLAPSKTFNLPGLGCGFAVSTNPAILERLRDTAYGIVPHVNIMGYVAAAAAYRYGQPWLDALLPYLRQNRDTLIEFVAERMPGIVVTRPQATYLAWLDCNALGVPDPQAFCLEEARVALNSGEHFGPGGDGFVRLNFGCPRSMLLEALESLADALARARFLQR